LDGCCLKPDQTIPYQSKPTVYLLQNSQNKSDLDENLTEVSKVGDLCDNRASALAQSLTILLFVSFSELFDVEQFFNFKKCLLNPKTSYK